MKFIFIFIFITVGIILLLMTKFHQTPTKTIIPTSPTITPPVSSTQHIPYAIITSKNTNDWNTYKDTFFGYTISLPTQWNLEKDHVAASELTTNFYSGSITFVNSATGAKLLLRINFQGDWLTTKRDELTTTSGLKVEKDTTETGILYYIKNTKYNVLIYTLGTNPNYDIDSIVKTLVIN